MAEPTRSADQLVNILLRDPQKFQDIAKQANPAKALDKMANEAIKQTPPIPDTPIYRMIISFLGGVGAVAAIGAIVLVAMGENPPDMLVALGSAGIGALAGLLAPSPVGR
jgi:hypothetical protein